MPLYDFLCPEGHEFEKALALKDFKKKVKCEECDQVAKRVIKTGIKEPTFSDRLYPYFDPNLNRVCNSPKEREQHMKELGFVSLDGKRSTTAKQERYLLQHRMHLRGNKEYRYTD